MKLSKGNRVVMHSCAAAEQHGGHVWNVSSDPFVFEDFEFVELEGLEDAFPVSNLQVVEVFDPFSGTAPISIQDIRYRRELAEMRLLEEKIKLPKNKSVPDVIREKSKSFVTTLSFDLIFKEREKQLEKHPISEDDSYTKEELSKAAASYLVIQDMRNDPDVLREKTNLLSPGFYPFGQNTWKPSPDDRLRELAIAGAFVVAEIERIQRIQRIKQKPEPEPETQPQTESQQKTEDNEEIK